LRVLPDGTINYTDVGIIQAAGKTVTELQEEIQRGLARVLVNHRVFVSVTELPPGGAAQVGRVAILGAVKQPGVVPVGQDTRLIEAIAELGGPLPTADLQRVQVTHRDLSVTQADLTGADQNLILREGDIVAIPEIQSTVLTASILGAVRQPGPYSFIPGLTTTSGQAVPGGLGVVVSAAPSLLDLLRAAGGPEPDADLEGATIRRFGQSEPLRVDLNRLWNQGDVSLNLRLVQGDVVVIPKNLAQAYILGAVAKPTVMPIRGGERLLDLLIAAGAPNENANLSSVSVSRMGPEGSRTERRVNLKNIGRGGDTAAANMALAPGDIVVVPAQKKQNTAYEQLTLVTSVLGILTSVRSLFPTNNNNNNNGRRRGNGNGNGGGGGTP